jgi:signal transduction histidine kinase
MKGGTTDLLDTVKNHMSDFEKVTLIGRWFGIVSLLAVYPHDSPSARYFYGLVVVMVLFNLTRSSKLFMRSRLYSSPVTMLLADNLFIGTLIFLVHNLSSPFQAFVNYPITAAAYRYRWRGTLVVVFAQLAWNVVVMRLSPFAPTYISGLQAVLITASLLFGLGFYVQGLTRVARDEKDKLEKLGQELEAGRMHLLTLVDSLNDAIFVVDDHGRVTDSNSAAAGLCDVEDPRGKSFAKLLQLHPHVNLDSAPVNLLSEGTAQHRRDLSVKLGSSAVIDLDITVQPVRLEEKRTTDYIVVCRDITKERSLDEQRNEFISVASHELRTPITIMEAALSTALIGKDKLDAQTGQLLEEAHRHSKYLASIVKDLAMMSQANNDNLPVKLEQLDPAKLVRQLGHDFESQAKQKSLELRVVIDENTPSVLSTESHIREILQNFLTNAVKYTEKGNVLLRVEASKNGGVRFSVHDTGIGLSPSDQKHLFTKFFRSEDFRTRSTGGSGLGLYLCRELAHRLNGRIWCESELNKGSIFFLEVPPVSQLKRDQKEVIQAEVANLVEGI